jgi:hypothetical protein
LFVAHATLVLDARRLPFRNSEIVRAAESAVFDVDPAGAK